MWSNTSPDGGLIVIGLADNGEVIGCAGSEQKHLNDLEKAGMDHCPDAKYVTRYVSTKRADGTPDCLLLFRVQYHPTKVVETSDRRVFVRYGDSKKEIKSDEERRELRIDKGEVQHEREPCGLSFPDDFDLNAIHAWAANVKKYRKLSVESSDPKLLEMMHLGTRKDETLIPNIACALLFSKDPVAIIPGCKVRFLRFDGIEERTGDKWNAVKDEWVSGPIPYQVVEAGRMIEAQIRKFSVFGKNGKFKTEPEYPADAWYEALVNACVHRSYNLKNMNIFVKMFDDRLEIDSPGPFPPGVTPQTIYDIQHSRNPFLMEALYYLDIVKAANEGVRRMRTQMLSLDLPAPEFSQTEIGGTKVRVILRNNIKSRRIWVDSDVSEMVGAAIAKSLDENQKLVLNFVAVHGSINVSDAQRLTGLYWKAAKEILASLERKGVLRYHRRPAKGGKDTHARWMLPDR